jgi:hypothetical protein
VFEEGDMVRIADAPGRRVPEAVGFGMGGVADEDAGYRALEDFGVVGWNERVGTATDFTEMGERGRAFVP